MQINNRQKSSEITPIALPNSEQFYLNNGQGEKYLIQVSWPLHWVNSDRNSHCAPLPVIYIVDGNALFLTATEAAWRRASASSRFAGGGIIVAIGYPLEGKVYDMHRRSLDLTPPSQSPTPGPGFGGADAFLDFIEGGIRPAVRARFPQLSSSREALYGHSFGGLFALYALFSRPRSFDCYIASSPSIWWNNQCILDHAKLFLGKEGEKKKGKKGEKKKGKMGEEDGEKDGGKEGGTSEEPLSPSLMLFVGSLEQNPPQWNAESLDHYEERKQDAANFRMVDNALDLREMLRSSSRLHTVSLKQYEGEEHTSVMACSMSRSLTEFFEDWPLPQ